MSSTQDGSIHNHSLLKNLLTWFIDLTTGNGGLPEVVTEPYAMRASSGIISPPATSTTQSRTLRFLVNTV